MRQSATIGIEMTQQARPEYQDDNDIFTISIDHADMYRLYITTIEETIFMYTCRRMML